MGVKNFFRSENGFLAICFFTVAVIFGGLMAHARAAAFPAQIERYRANGGTEEVTDSAIRAYKFLGDERGLPTNWWEKIRDDTTAIVATDSVSAWKGYMIRR